MKLNQTYVLMVFLTVFFGCNKNSEKQIINIQKGKVGMVGYGSLMSKNSMEKTLRRTYQDSVYLVHLEGYHRSWNASYSVINPNRDFFYLRNEDSIQIHNVLALNIIESDNEKMNCVLFFITPEELAEFDIREEGYNRIDVTDKINEYEFKGGEVYAYKADKEHTYNFELKDNTVLPKPYFELVTKACDSIGVEFRQEFESSTKHLDKVIILPDSDVISIDK
ncbi:gamma-glutamylcyclotransferase family protein [Pseudotamlana agarivorans]|uniref:gamma-glutamylcyclotransferase family protein n=1 Tax=Pseudotamlana agarivorans TaxID=481183 RepID=UPI00082B97C1|nr:gamma-glutamylcyclotransferase family protein [Tamlana agarivorans]